MSITGVFREAFGFRGHLRVPSLLLRVSLFPPLCWPMIDGILRLRSGLLVGSPISFFKKLFLLSSDLNRVL
jgi:hypothetical protein